MKKKLFGVLTGLLGFMLVLAACGDDKPAPTSAAAQANPTAAAASTTAPAAPGNPEAGLQIFQANACGSCHLKGGREEGTGPLLLNTKRDDAYIRSNIRNGKGLMSPYPPNVISDQQLNDLVAYIKSLK